MAGLEEPEPARPGSRGRGGKDTRDWTEDRRHRRRYQRPRRRVCAIAHRSGDALRGRRQDRRPRRYPLRPAAGRPADPVDTGFIVYNERTYPLLTRMFAELGVATRPSEMSMSVSCAGCGLQYAGKRGLGGLAAGLSRGRGRYARMLAEVPRFHRAARRLLASAESDPRELQTLGEFLADGGYSDYFTTHFALPLVAAVWSCPPGTALSYPARYLFAFLANHGMLSVTGSPQWRTVTGGSRSYVEQVLKRLPETLISTQVTELRRYPGGVLVRDASGEARLLRRRRRGHPSRPGPAAPQSAHPGRTRGARRVPLHPEPGPAAHRRQRASRPPRRPGLMELRAERLPPRSRGGPARSATT